MRVISFQIYCIEFYSAHTQVPSPQVYQKFRDAGLLDLLSSDYEDLHGLGTEALMQFCDQFLGKEAQGCQTKVEHGFIRTILIPAILEIVCKERQLQPQKAMKLFYESCTAKALADEDTGLYGQSPLALAGMFMAELDRGNKI